MIAKLINFILELLGIYKTPKKQSDLESKKESLEDKLKEIQNEKTNIDDIINRINK